MSTESDLGRGLRARDEHGEERTRSTSCLQWALAIAMGLSAQAFAAAAEGTSDLEVLDSADLILTILPGPEAQPPSADDRLAPPSAESEPEEETYGTPAAILPVGLCVPVLGPGTPPRQRFRVRRRLGASLKARGPPHA